MEETIRTFTAGLVIVFAAGCDDTATPTPIDPAQITIEATYALKSCATDSRQLVIEPAPPCLAGYSGSSSNRPIYLDSARMVFRHDRTSTWSTWYTHQSWSCADTCQLVNEYESHLTADGTYLVTEDGIAITLPLVTAVIATDPVDPAAWQSQSPDSIRFTYYPTGERAAWLARAPASPTR